MKRSLHPLRSLTVLHPLTIICALWLSLVSVLVGSGIPAERLPAGGMWQPGIPGGIPTNYKQFCNVRLSIPGTLLVAIGDGLTDDQPAIQTAVNACPDGQYVYIPTGNYRLNNPITRTGINRYDGKQYPFSILIRGDGPANTKLLFYGGGGIVLSHAGGYIGNWPITSGNTRGSTTLTCAGGFNFVYVGQWVLILRDDTQAGVYRPPANDPNPFYYNYTNCASQFVKVTGISGNTLTFTPALNEGYANDKLAIYASPPTRCGIEDLYVENKADTSAHNIRIMGGQECWVKNVESNTARQYHLSLEECAGCEVRSCYVHDTYPVADGNNGGGSSDYGICLGFYSSNNLVENNIALHTRHAFIMETAAGENNVFGYNYSKDPINEGLLQTDYLMGDLTTHGGEPRFNLFEGNVASTVRFDTIEGATKYDTVFRNQLTRVGLPSTYIACFAMDIQRGNYFDNFLGNVYQALPAGFKQPATPLYRLGSVQDIPNIDPTVVTQNLFHGNIDLTNGSVVWDASTSDHTLPASFYLSAKPSWWDSSVWPAIGPDLLVKSGANPAFRRWQSSQGATPPSPKNLHLLQK